jgi:hypothetical protein
LKLPNLQEFGQRDQLQQLDQELQQIFSNTAQVV